jgi:hypothetical protein
MFETHIRGSKESLVDSRKKNEAADARRRPRPSSARNPIESVTREEGTMRGATGLR